MGALQDGTVFDSTQAHGQPFTFTLGAGQVIAGWDQGVAGMKVGGQRTLVIPPSLGYGAAGAGNGLIPPNATLLFEIQLDDVQKGHRTEHIKITARTNFAFARTCPGCVLREKQ